MWRARARRRSQTRILAAQVLSLQESNIHVTSLTSLTPKEEIAEIYKTIDTDTGLRLIYGAAS